MSEIYSVESAAALLPEVRRRAAEFVGLRADFASLSAAVRVDGPSASGGLADVKALEARMHEQLAWFTEHGLEVKGWAPLTLDFPAILDGQAVLLCWLENEPELAWWHSPDLGFAGRRPLPPLP